MNLLNYHSVNSRYRPSNRETISRWLINVAKKEKKVIGAISVIFCSDDYLLWCNQKYLRHNYYTDIITFDYCKANTLNGDLFISHDRIKYNAQKYKRPINEETRRVIVHGLLHLCGYDDKTREEKVIMKDKENFYLVQFSRFA